ncbi:class I SAM-dependent methyltransferase [Caballeronia sp. CLC5]|nr:class I SAM-dependent methyltransferase [Caballeronia sp. CLC5]MCE4567103.1 class I SAM-dependent methyltransferase [Caballeronia sp. CLC5]
MSDRMERTCPVCRASASDADAFLDERVDPSTLDSFSFASRKEPEFFNYRMVRCRKCDVVYVDRPPSQQALAQAYHEADFDSVEEANDAATAYLRELAPALRRVERNSALEIGTGTGVLLEGLVERGFARVVGIEPSPAAIAAAPANRRAWIREGIFQEHDYEPASFDLVCCFMTLEHVREPLEIAESVLRLLKPGGAFVTVTHDYRSAVNRLLGRRSPIIDIEHMQLFSQSSIAALLGNAGYVDVAVKPFVNRYAISYWTRLLPLNSAMKQGAMRLLSSSGLGRLKASFNVGNTVAVGYRPHESKGTDA